MKKNIVVFVFLLIILSSVISAEEVNPGIAIKFENSTIGDMVLFGGTIDMSLANDFILDGFVATDTSFDSKQFYAELNLLKKFSEENNYYLGLGYKHVKDEESNFNNGDTISKNVLYAKLVGINYYNGFKLTTDISFSPYGKFKYNNGSDSGDLDSWYVELGIEKPIHDSLNLFLVSSYGYDQLTDINTQITSYSFGLSYDM